MSKFTKGIDSSVDKLIEMVVVVICVGVIGLGSFNFMILTDLAV